jgi:hypothetical protein
MRMAVELASKPAATELELERARVWVIIAHELRAGAAAAAVPKPRPLDGPSFIVDEDVTTGLPDRIFDYRRAQIAGPSMSAVVLAKARLEMISRGAVVHDDEMSLLREIIDRSQQAPETRCAYCPHSLVWVTPGPNAGNQTPRWVHAVTMQEVCPSDALEGDSRNLEITRTFAMPMADGRG